ncbi:FG-GAP-like repeat-containing protein [Cellulomonas sp. URHB0016]
MGVRKGWAVRVGATAAVLVGVGVPAAYAVTGSTPTGAVAAATVKVDVGGKGACSGALLSPGWVITAKSCFEQTTGAPLVKGAPTLTTTATIGRVDLTGSAGTVVGVTLLVPHPDQDVVLAKLATQVNDVAPVKVATTPPATGDTVTVTGYGRTATALVPDTAHAAAFTITDVAAATLDLQADETGATICKGDAGGPTLRTTSTGIELLALHHSAYQGGCLGQTTTRQGATDTRLDTLRDWITQNTRSAQGADFDGDGKADVFWASQADGRWRMSYGGTTPWAAVNGAPGIRTDMLRFADFDGDGKDDVFFANPWDGRWMVSYGGTGGWVTVNNAGVPNDQLALGDFMGDGKADVFWVRPSDGLWFVSDDAVGGWRQINGAPGIRTDQLRIADVNGDGKDDVFLANPWDGRWMVSYSGTTGWVTVNNAGVPNDQLGLADLTGDGKADVFWVRPSDGLWFISDGTVGGWRNINGAQGIPATMYQLADMNGDGKADVFFANPWDGRWMVSDAGTAGWTSVNGAAEVLPDRVAVR